MSIAAKDLSTLDATAKAQIACSLAVLILHDEKSDVTADKVAKLTKNAKVTIPEYWPILFAKNFEGKKIEDFIHSKGAAPAVAAQAEAPKAEAAKDAKAGKDDKKKEKKEEAPPVEEAADLGDLFG